MDKKQKMTDKVAKLLRQAEDVAGTPEEAVFQAKAFEIIAKYGIEQAQVDAQRAGLDVTEMPDAIKMTFIVNGKYASAQLSLINNLARALHGKAVSETMGGGVFHMHVFAMERHMERIAFLWMLLRPQMLRQVDVVRPDGDQRRVKSYRRAWIAGFGHTIGERVREQEAAALDGSSGALVLYRGDVQRAEIALQGEYGGTIRTQRPKFSSSGWAAGKAAGQRASLARAIA